ncbi:MAG: extracellular solute-binding protein [Haloarculaceae archaeon]
MDPCDESRTRRAVLGLLPLVVGGVAGCTSLQLGSDRRGETASVLAAGSLAVAFDERIGPGFAETTDYDYRGEFHGSNALLRMVVEGYKQPDVVVSADADLLRDRLEPAHATWDVVFASTEVVIVYDPATPAGKRLAEGDPWYEVLRSTDRAVARSDPEVDPLGYRTVQLFDLAEVYYDEPGLAEDLRGNLIVDPEEAHLLAAVETGDRAAAIAYKNMAVERDLPYLSLPAELDFSDPRQSDRYARASYTTADGRTIHGSPILYAATVPDDARHPEAGRAFLKFLLDRPELLRERGLVVSDGFPRPNGDVPAEVLP